MHYRYRKSYQKHRENRRKELVKKRIERKKYLHSLSDEAVLHEFGGEKDNHYWNNKANENLYRFIFQQVAKDNWTHIKMNRWVKKLKRHLESRFEEGMNWANFVSGKWQIDHIIPKSRPFIARSQCAHSTGISFTSFLNRSF